MAKKINPATILSPDTFFYTIPFEQPGQILTREVLAKHYPVPKGRWAHMGIHAEYKGFKKGLVSVNVKLPDNSDSLLFLHVGLTELDIACTCSMPEHKLCHHAYMGLHSLTWCYYVELNRYYWPGLTSDDNIRDKFLDTKVTKNWISVRPKTKYGNIFKSTIGFAGDKYLAIDNPAGAEKEIVGSQEVIAYCLAYNLGGHTNLFLPVLAPCLGITSKNNNAIVSFKQFNRRDKLINNVTFTSNQEQLNDISLKQFDLAKGFDDLSDEEKKQDFAKSKQAILTLWEQAIPLLLNEKYNYSYNTYWLKYLRDKPRKGDFRDLKYNLERPVLSFLLKFHQDHFSLVAVVTVDGNVLQFKYKPHLFVFDEDTKSCYLTASVQDDNLLMWILSNNKQLTVLKQDFVEFHNTFLAKVITNYSVLFTNPESKKTTPYSFEMIANEILNRGNYGK